MTDYKILDVYSDNIDTATLDNIKDFCQKAVSENKHAARSNMDVESWQTNPSSLLYLLLIEKRFLKERGGLQLLLCDNEIVGISGYYRSDFDPYIYLMGVRSWVLKSNRFNLLIAKFMLPHQLNKISQLGGRTAVISFNDSTLAFGKLIKRANRNPESNLKFFFGENYPDIYKDMIFWDLPVKIKNVKQWILIKNILPHDFNWQTIQWQDTE